MAGFTGAQPIVTDGLVFAVDAANYESYPGSGTTWSDLSGNGNNGTLVNGPVFSKKNAGCIIFDDTDDYAVFPHNNVLNVDAITVEMVCSFHSLFNGYGVSKRYSYNNNNAFFLGLGSSTKLRWQHTTNGSANISLDYDTSDLNTNDIYYIVGTYDDSINDKKLYLNNVEVASTSTNGDLYHSSEDLYIGTDGRLANGFNAMDDFYILRIYNRALSSTEVLQNYNALKSRFNL
jgi:hypothetical protein